MNFLKRKKPINESKNVQLTIFIKMRCKSDEVPNVDRQPDGRTDNTWHTVLYRSDTNNNNNKRGETCVIGRYTAHKTREYVPL